MTVKFRKSRGCRYYGRGHKSHKSGSKGGVGRAGIWAHNKNARKFRVFETKSKPSYVDLTTLLNNINNIIQSDQLNLLNQSLSVKPYFQEIIIKKENNTFLVDLVLESKYKKVLGIKNEIELENMIVNVSLSEKKHFKKEANTLAYKIKVLENKIIKEKIQ